MGEFFAELRQRHIVRVGAAYAVVAWVLLQLVNNLIPLLHLPDWAGTLVLVLLGVGFPVFHHYRPSQASFGDGRTVAHAGAIWCRFTSSWSQWRFN